MSFDFVFLASIFTHMYPNDVKHYLSEIFRVLKTGAKCLMSCFLLNSESYELMKDSPSSTRNFCYPLEDCFVIDKNAPENAIAFDEAKFLEWISREGFHLESKLYGNWCGRAQFVSYQDILIVKKEG